MSSDEYILERLKDVFPALIGAAVRAGTSLKINRDLPGDLNEFAVD